MRLCQWKVKHFCHLLPIIWSLDPSSYIAASEPFFHTQVLHINFRKMTASSPESECGWWLHRLSGRAGPAHTSTLHFPDQSPQYIHVSKVLQSVKDHSGRQSGGTCAPCHIIHSWSQWLYNTLINLILVCLMPILTPSHGPLTIPLLHYNVTKLL